MRTGGDYLRSLQDGRRVYLDGERVAAALRERMTFVSPKTGEPVWRCFQIPRNAADLKARRLFSETWAEATFGLTGRTPDHVASFFAGYAAAPQVLAAGGT